MFLESESSGKNEYVLKHVCAEVIVANLKYCPICGNTNSSNALKCRICDADLTQGERVGNQTPASQGVAQGTHGSIPQSQYNRVPLGEKHTLAQEGQIGDTPPKDDQNPDYLPPDFRDMMRRKLNQKPLKRQSGEAAHQPWMPPSQQIPPNQQYQPNQQIPPNQQYQPNQQGYVDPRYAQQGYVDPNYPHRGYIDPRTGMMYHPQGIAPIAIRAPVPRRSSNVFTMVKNFFISPSESKGDFEDPTAPSAKLLIYISALFAFIEAYFMNQSTTYITPDNISPSPVVDGIFTALSVTLSVYIGSFFLAALIRNHMPINSPMRLRVRAMTVKLNAIRSLIFIPVAIAKTVMYLLGESRTIRYLTVDPAELFSSTETIEIVSNFSNQYFFVVGIVLIVCYIISSFYLYIALKRVFEVRGIRPMVLAVLTMAYGMISAVFAVLPAA